jgi:hypothetical protein
MLYQTQNDPKWSKTLIKNSRMTVGGYGCALTSVGNVIGKTPIEVMNMCRMPNGLVDWTSIKTDVWKFKNRSNGFERQTLREGVPTNNRAFVILINYPASPTKFHWVAIESLGVGGYNCINPYGNKSNPSQAVKLFVPIGDVIRHVEFIKF